MSGIGDNEAFNRGLEQRYEVVDYINFEDHHSYLVRDVKLMQQMLNQHPDAVILTTEKDAVKISRSSAIPAELRSRLFYEKITMLFMEEGRAELFAKIDNDIKNKDNERYIKGF
jgi:tetraacyldisaccharide 4'-kinase